MIRKSIVAAAVLAVLGGGHALAQSTGWQFRTQGNPEAFTRNQSGSSALVLECVQGRHIWMRIVAPRGWQANLPVQVSVGGRSFPMQIEGGSDYVVLTDAPGRSVSPDLLAAMKTESTLTLGGPAAARMSQTDRAFRLAGASAPIARVEQVCGSRATATPAASPTASRPDETALRAKVRQFLAGQLREAKEANGRDADLNIQLVDLNGDGVPEALVTINHIYWCGSGGCAGRVLELSGPTARNIGEFLLDQFRPLPTSTGGWRDLSINGRKVTYRNGRYGR